MGRVLIQIGSRSIGDTVSCIPYIDKFRENTDDEIFVELNDGFIFLEKQDKIAYDKTGTLYQHIL
jgi:hypothetical protein